MQEEDLYQILAPKSDTLISMRGKVAFFPTTIGAERLSAECHAVD